MTEENLYEVTVTVSYTEEFYVERETPEEARDYAEWVVRDDIQNDIIDTSMMDVDVDAEEVER